MSRSYAWTRWVLALVGAAGALVRPASIVAQIPAASSPPPDSAVQAPAGPSGPVVELQFDPAFADEDPWVRTGLRHGEPIDDARVRQALRSALESGTFAAARATVRQVPGGLRVTIQGQRRIRVQEVAFVGVGGRGLDTVRRDFGLSANAWATQEEVSAAVDRLRQAYLDAGWAEVSVSARLRDTDNPESRVVIVSVTEGSATRVHAVVLDGVPADVAETVRGALGLATGDVADPVTASRALEAISGEIRRRGYIGAVVQPIRIVPAGHALADVVVTVRAGPHYRLEWHGIDPYPVTAVETALRLDEERALDVSTTNALVNRVREYFVRRGYLDVSVRTELRNEGAADDRKILRFLVDRGARVRLRAVDFPGADHVSPRALRDIINDLLENELPFGEYAESLPRPNGMPEHPQGTLAGGPGFLWIHPEREYVPELFAEARHRLETRYREQGFLDAHVGTPDVTRSRDTDGALLLDVRIAVTEGPQTELFEVTFQGNRDIASATLAEHVGLSLGVPLSYPALEASRTALTDYYREQGHLFARVDRAVEPSPDRTRARVRFDVHEGPEVRVGRILVRGNTRTPEWVIRQRVDFRSGEVFRLSSIRTTQRRLGELGLFSGVTITPIDADVEAPVKDIQVQVLELRPQWFEVRFGFSTGEGVRAGMDYGYRDIHLGGLTLSAALSLQLGYQVFIAPGDPIYQQNYQSLSLGDQIRRRASLSILLPAIEALGPFFRGTVDVSTARHIERQFALDTSTASTTLTFRPSRLFTASITPEIQFNGLQLIQQGLTSVNMLLTTLCPYPNAPMCADADRVARLLLLPVGSTLLGALRFTAALDLRDQIFNPTRGFYMSGTVEYVGIISPPSISMPSPSTQLVPGDAFHTSASVSGYIPLPLGIVFASSLRGGFNFVVSQPAHGTCPVTYPNRLFFMGGSDTMRGWLQDTLIPQDVIDAYLRPSPSSSPGGCGGTATSGIQAADITLTERGGDVFFNWRNELRVPLGHTGFALAGFLDLGNLWKDLASFGRDLQQLISSGFSTTNAHTNLLRASAGAGIRYITPIGPVALDLGFNLQPYPSFEQQWVFHFSIGTF